MVTVTVVVGGVVVTSVIFKVSGQPSHRLPNLTVFVVTEMPLLASVNVAVFNSVTASVSACSTRTTGTYTRSSGHVQERCTVGGFSGASPFKNVSAMITTGSEQKSKGLAWRSSRTWPFLTKLPKA